MFLLRCVIYKEEFLNYCNNLRRQEKKVVFCGDVNTAHNEIDLARPRQIKNTTGFLRVERDWIDDVVRQGYVDTFRD
ncbi:MAG: exodeoxyribonuclease III, partial [Chloroflexota bacterium]